jgi:hypothetical protein
MDTLRPWNAKAAKKFLKVINGNKKIWKSSSSP